MDKAARTRPGTDRRNRAEGTSTAQSGRLDLSRARRRAIRKHNSFRRLVAWSLALFFKTAPGLSSTVILMNVIDALMSSAFLAVLAWIVARSGDDATRGAGPDAVVIPLAVLVGSMIFSNISGTFLVSMNALLTDRVAWEMTERLVDVIGGIEASHFDLPQFHDEIQQAERAYAEPGSLVGGILGLISSLIGVVGVSSVIFVLNPVVVSLVVLSAIPVMLAQRVNARHHRKVLNEMAEMDRRRKYIRGLLTRREYAAEVRSYELMPYLRRLRIRLHGQTLRITHRLFFKAVPRLLVAGLISSVLLALGLSWIVLQAAEGRISTASVAIGASASFQLSGHVTALLGNVSGLYESSLYVGDFRKFEQLYGKSRQEPGTGSTVSMPDDFDTITIDDVSFDYPGSTKGSLHHVSMVLRRGEVVAVVGANGSGKTTLAKLLSNIYPPTSGKIIWDDLDIARVSPTEYRRRVAVLFQNFGRYQLTPAMNIGAGRITQITDRASIKYAAELSGAGQFVDALPHRFDTPLGKAFKGGTELSGGQWQRLAIARAIFRRAPLVILDEPTAALDPIAEHEIYRSMRELFANRTVLLISHRLTSIQFADRIYVLDEGRVAEVGTHDELIAADGKYAHMYRLQEESREGGLLAHRRKNQS